MASVALSSASLGPFPLCLFAGFFLWPKVSFIPPEVVQGVTTTWLPITTAYPSLNGCASAYFLYPGQPYPVAWDPGYGYFAGAALSCLPPQATTWWEQEHQNPDGYTRLSIQPIVCPSAFTTAATEVHDSSSTLVKCCPSGYDLVSSQPGRIVGDCYSALTPGQVITYTAQDASSTWTSMTSTVPSTWSSMLAIPIEGYNVARAATSTTTSSLVSPSPSSNQIQPSNAAEQADGLSNAATAGISVAATVAGITIVGLVFWLIRRRRTHRGTRSNVKPSELHATSNYKPTAFYGQYSRPAELATK